jgi:hypothetical protein
MVLEQLLGYEHIEKLTYIKLNPQTPCRLGVLSRSAELLGVCYVMVHRLLQQGLLRGSLALRKKVIAKVEIERFLKETSDTL